LTVQQEETSGAIQHDGKDLALLELAEGQEKELNKENDPPAEISQSKNRTALENYPAPFSLREKED
jgi:hypothetical protein